MNILSILSSIIVSKWFMLTLYILYMVVVIFESKIASKIAYKKMNNILSKVEKSTCGLLTEEIHKYDMEDKFSELSFFTIKYMTYLVLFISVTLQLIISLISTDYSILTINVCILTSAVSFTEYRDNKRTSNKMMNEIDLIIKKLCDNATDLSVMICDDINNNS